MNGDVVRGLVLAGHGDGVAADFFAAVALGRRQSMATVVGAAIFGLFDGILLALPLFLLESLDRVLPQVAALEILTGLLAALWLPLVPIIYVCAGGQITLRRLLLFIVVEGVALWLFVEGTRIADR